MAHPNASAIYFVFTRPEPLSGLHQLAFFVTNDPEVVQSPWSAGCGSLATWPLRYLSQGLSKAVVGGWDPSSRKFFKVDELSFTVPYSMFRDMVARAEESFQSMRKKIAQSRKAWGGGVSVDLCDLGADGQRSAHLPF